MAQIQSTWFPLYDRNPQKFCSKHLFGARFGLRARDPERLSFEPLSFARCRSCVNAILKN
jgi:hypothetical protein